MITIDGRTHSRLVGLMSEALNAKDSGAVTGAIAQIQSALGASTAPISLPEEVLTKAAVAALSHRKLTDRQIDYVNALLPWSSFVIDAEGRLYGNRYTATKRAAPATLRDRRIDHLASLLDRPHLLSVAEYGCFEGNHTSQLCKIFAAVIAIDGRIENCIKTLVRCWLVGAQPDVQCINLEQSDTKLPFSDVCHHVGVLYHLTRPAQHLDEVLARTRVGMLLDTQIARPADCNTEVEVLGRMLAAYRYREPDVGFAPFAGMEDHAIWLTFDTICKIAESRGFSVVDSQQREERNGARASFYLIAKP